MFGQNGNLAGMLLPLVVFIVLMYLFLIRPQKKKDKEIQAMRNSLGPGDEIVTIGGIKGKILKVKDESFILQVGADKTKIEFMRWAVSKVTVSKGNGGTADPAMEEDAAPKKPSPKRLKKSTKTEEVIETVSEEAETVTEESTEE